VLRLYVPGETLADTLPRLRETYCGTIAYEIEHIADHEKRVWLRQAIESGKYRRPLSAGERKELLASLSRVEAFEQYLRRAFLGQKQFSIEGLDVMVPMLDEAIELAAENGAHEVVIGMAHRGRLNVLAHTLGLGYDSIIREFEGERTIDALVATDEGGTGDVSTTWGRKGLARRRRGRSRSRSRRTRATSRRSTPSSRVGRAPSRPTARLATACTIRASRCRSSSTATRASPGRARSPRPSTSPRSTATRRAGHCT
jgi:hypothetical protein